MTETTHPAGAKLMNIKLFDIYTLSPRIIFTRQIPRRKYHLFLMAGTIE